MINKKLNVHVAVISHNRPHNVQAIQSILGDCTFYVNNGERKAYQEAGAHLVVEAGENICQARNCALKQAASRKMPSIQVSDDLRSLKQVSIVDGKYIVKAITFEHVVKTMVDEMALKGFCYGGVSVTTNRLNYTGVDFSYDKLIVCDLICVMPAKRINFDEGVALKEDYDLTIKELIYRGGVVRCDNFLCDFPHRDNKGGANDYRDNRTESVATKRLFAKWGKHIKNHNTRDGQISLDYKQIKATRAALLQSLRKD